MSTVPASQRLRPFRPQRFGRYTLLMPLSTGGMGEVFLARLEGSHGFDKLCVIKKILPHLASEPGFVARFVDEGRILVKLSHGNIAQVLDMGVHEDAAPYMALEFIDGKDLRRVLARTRERQLPLPLSFVLSVMTRVLDALAYAHRKRGDDDREINLVHRDMSPQNILISYEGEVKVIDFGLAKSALSESSTHPSILLGKFMYMSPEQARHRPVDRRSDLYAVGLCLWELVTGKSPFEDVPPGELMGRVGNPEIPPLNTVDPLCPRALSEAVARALQVEPDQRFGSAEEFRAALQSVLQAIDPNAGAESTSRFMRDAFASEYQQERRMLLQVKEQARTLPDEEEVPTQLKSPAGGRPAFLSGNEPTPMAAPALGFQPTALSFSPTRKSGAAAPSKKDDVHEKETLPAIQLRVDNTGTPTPAVALPTPMDEGVSKARTLARSFESEATTPSSPAIPETPLPSVVVEDLAPEVSAPVPVPQAPPPQAKKRPAAKLRKSNARHPKPTPPPAVEALPPPQRTDTMIIRNPLLLAPALAPPPAKKGGGWVWFLVPLLALGAVVGFIVWDRQLEQARQVPSAPPEVAEVVPPVSPEVSAEAEQTSEPVADAPPPPEEAAPPAAAVEVAPQRKAPVGAPATPRAAASDGAVALKALERDFGRLVDANVAQSFRLRLTALQSRVGSQGTTPAYLNEVKALHGQVKAALAEQP